MKPKRTKTSLLSQPGSNWIYHSPLGVNLIISPIFRAKLQIGNSYLPFGGVGESGIGSYHGIHGLERFSHKKSIPTSATWIDLPLLYAHYKDKIKYLRWILK